MLIQREWPYFVLLHICLHICMNVLSTKSFYLFDNDKSGVIPLMSNPPHTMQGDKSPRA